jgi:hypothetical protein
MTTPAMSEYLYLLDAAFSGPDWHSLLTNLSAVTPDDWTWVPPGGSRSIRDIIRHVGGSKLMYHEYAFGEAKLTFDDPLVDGVGVLDTTESAAGWLRDIHAQLRESVAALNDAELSRPRLTNWGEQKETRWIISTMIQHDLYHAGEINHLRSLRSGRDRWAYEQG